MSGQCTQRRYAGQRAAGPRDDGQRDKEDVLDILGGKEEDSERLHYISQISVKKPYELFEIFHLMSLDHG